jgi:hypothetical protein
MKQLRHPIHDGKLLRRYRRLARHTFSQYVGEQPRASCQDVASSRRAGGLIEKCLSRRYGVSSTTSVEVLLQGLWLKEQVPNGRKHLAATSQIVELDLAEMCQEVLNVDKILHNFDDYALSRTEKLA